MIPYGRQSVSEEDIQAVVDVLRSDWLTQGPLTARFEEAFRQRCAVNFALAVSSGTAGLHLACRAIGLGPGDRLWTSPNSFVASANCGLYCGATVDFIDIDPRSYNLSVTHLEEKLFDAKRNGMLPKALVAVHFGGQSCDMARVQALAQEYDFFIIEDACHALGGSYLDTVVGSCRYSHLSVFSFHPVKSITTGEGGMVVTNDETLHQRLSLLRNHGITKQPGDLFRDAEGGWYYEQQELGYNYRMTDMQAALGLSQLQRLDAFTSRRQALAERYNAELAEMNLTTPWQDPRCQSAWHLYPVWLHEGKEKRRAVYDKLHAAGIGVQVHYIPVHTQPFFQAMGFKWGDYPNTENYYSGTLSLPIFYDLSDEEQDVVIQTLSASL